MSPIVACTCGLWALGTLDDRRGLAAWPRVAGRVRCGVRPVERGARVGCLSGRRRRPRAHVGLGRRARQRVQPDRQHRRRGGDARGGHLCGDRRARPHRRRRSARHPGLRAGRGLPRLPSLQPHLARAHLPGRRRQPSDRLRGGGGSDGAPDGARPRLRARPRGGSARRRSRPRHGARLDLAAPRRPLDHDRRARPPHPSPPDAARRRSHGRAHARHRPGRHGCDRDRGGPARTRLRRWLPGRSGSSSQRLRSSSSRAAPGRLCASRASRRRLRLPWSSLRSAQPPAQPRAPPSWRWS